MLVIKIGGGEGLDLEAITSELASLSHPFILVHGGSHELNRLQEKLGNAVVTYTSPSGFTSRRTDRATMDMFQMIYCGKVNKRIVELFRSKGVNALGLSGMDGGLALGKRKDSIRVIDGGKQKIVRDDLSGNVESINVDLIALLSDNGYIPVIAPPAITAEGLPINVDGDRLAAQIAAAMHAEELVIVSNVSGLLADINNASSLIHSIPFNSIDEHIEKYAQGRMKKKLLGAKEALQQGVKRVRITNSINSQGTVIQ